MRATPTLALLLSALAAAGCASETTDSDRSGETPSQRGDTKRDASAPRDGGSNRDRDSATSSRDGGKPAASEGPKCGDTVIRAKALPSDMLIVQDRSSSMSGVSISAGVGNDRWTPSVGALKQVVSDYDDVINFGLLLFPSAGQSCDRGSVSVPITELASDMISAALDANAPSALVNGIGQTPTDLALQQALEVINARPSPIDLGVQYDAYVLLVTDGAPGCNLGGTEQARVEASNRAIDALLEIGVKTFVVGYDIDAPGQAIMNGFAQHGGTDHYIAVDTMDAQSLETALRDVTSRNVPCKFKLPGTPPSTSDVTVKIDDVDVVISTEDGWTIDGSIVELNGPACTGIRDGQQHDVEVNVPCDVLLL